MINTLEDIGVISRKNSYQLSNESLGCKQCFCRVVMDDFTEINLSETNWKNVIESGLRACGIIENQNLKTVKMVECNAG